MWEGLCMCVPPEIPASVVGYAEERGSFVMLSRGGFERAPRKEETKRPFR